MAQQRLYPILVIGDVMLDVIVRPHGPPAPASDTHATIRPVPGGSGANVAAWIAHLGDPVIFCGRVGARDYAQHVALLRAAGVEPVLARDEEVPTGTIVTLLAPGGERSFFTDRGANERLSRSDLPDALLERIGLIHLSGYALFADEPRAAVLDFVRLAAARGVLISIDPGSASFIREAGAARFLEWSSRADLFFPNADEAEALCDTDVLDEQIAFLSPRHATLVVKRGAQGAVAVDGASGERSSVSAPSVASVDATGAGDAFLAAFLTARLRGASTRDCLERAVSAGARATTILGGRPG